MPLQRLEPQVQGPILTMTTDAREPEWTESNSNLLLYGILLPAWPSRERVAGRGPSERDGSSSICVGTHRSVFRITLLLLWQVQLFP